MDKYIIEKQLGRGSFGVVFLTKNILDSKKYVLKRIQLAHVSQKRRQSAIQQVEILKQLQHPYIIKYFQSFQQSNQLSIIMQYAQGGDLQQLLLNHRQRKQLFTQKQIWRIGLELSQALSYLHTRRIIHRDIKCHNILLTKELQVKLGDLGASKIANLELQATRVGTPLYLAPELIKQQPYDFKVDIWALGCVLYNLATLEAPFQGKNIITLGFSILNKRPKKLPSNFTNKLEIFIFSLLEKQARNRPDIVEILKQFQVKSKPIQDMTTNFSEIPLKQEKIDPPRPVFKKNQKQKPFEMEKLPEKPVFRQESNKSWVIKQMKPQRVVIKPSLPLFNRPATAHTKPQRSALSSVCEIIQKQTEKPPVVIKQPKRPLLQEKRERPLTAQINRRVVQVRPTPKVNPLFNSPEIRSLIRSSTVVQFNIPSNPPSTKNRVTIRDLINS